MATQVLLEMLVQAGIVEVVQTQAIPDMVLLVSLATGIMLTVEATLFITGMEGTRVVVIPTRETLESMELDMAALRVRREILARRGILVPQATLAHLGTLAHLANLEVQDKTELVETAERVVPS